MRALLSLISLLLCLVAGTALAQPWPGRPIHLVVAYPPGGVSDEISRALADKLAAQLGTPVLVEHRAGAGGALAMEMLAKAPSDGYTLVFSAISPLVLTPHLGRVGYEPLKDIAPVVGVMFTPVLLVGTPALKASNFAEMLEAARSPGGVRWATSGLATTGHRVLEQVKLISGANITHIPYKGGGQQLNDALGGQFELLSSNVGAQQLQHIRSGRFKPLAVGAPNRLDVLPDVPTLAELGYAPANLVSLFGIFAPGKTPEPVLARLNTELNRALQLPDIRQRLLAVNNLPAGGSAADFARHIAREWELNRRLVEAAGGQFK
nr:tripartite tricarboxylate transporter substrate binding protein [uncultured Roseateles sp.]